MREAPLARLRRAAGSPFDLASGALLLLATFVVLFTFADYGMSWDEPYAVVYGRNAVAFYRTLGAERAAAQGLLSLRGPLFQLLVEAVARFAPDDGLLVRRLLTPLCGVLGVAGCWRLARLLAGPAAGLLGAALLLLAPIYYGHMFINPADLPFAVAYVWALYFAARLITELPRVDARALLGAALALGLGASIRIGGVLVLGYAALLFAARVASARAARDAAGAAALLRSALCCVPALLGLAYLVMLAAWPAALLDPLHVPVAAVAQAAAYPKHEPVLLAGQRYWSDALPWFYQLGYLLAQLPEQLSIAALAGAALLARALHRAWRAGEAATWVPAAMVLLGAFVPLACASAARPVDYDGMRHVLFVVPPLACLASAGVVHALRALAPRPALVALLVALLAGSSAQTLAAMAELHPYEYVYYNASVGGTRGARGRYELDYWVTSFREALSGLDAYLARARANGAAVQAHPRLAVCGHAAVAYVYLPRGVVLTRAAADADFVLATTKWDCDRRFSGEVIARVERAGVPFAVVKRVQSRAVALR